jgi:hypothetical protein
VAELSNWGNIVVPQRYYTGCVQTGFEWLIRYLCIQGVNLDTFQEDFDLGEDNSFDSVASKIEARYSGIDIRIQSFINGLVKVNFIRTLIENQQPCLISLALGGKDGWHIMPVVRIDDKTIAMIHHADHQGNHTWTIPLEEAVSRHDNLEGGNDIAWIEI